MNLLNLLAYLQGYDTPAKRKEQLVNMGVNKTLQKHILSCYTENGTLLFDFGGKETKELCTLRVQRKR